MLDKNILPILPIKASVVLPHVEMRIEVGRPFSKNAIIQSEVQYENQIVLLFQKNEGDVNGSLTLDDCYEVGILAQFDNKIKLPNSNFKIKFNPYQRVKVLSLYTENDCIYANFEIMNDIYADDNETISLVNKINTQVLEKGSSFLKNTRAVVDEMNRKGDAGTYSDILASNIIGKEKELFPYLKEADVNTRLKSILEDIEVVFFKKELDDKIDKDVRMKMEKAQKEYYLREKIRSIQEELGDVDNATSDIETLRKKIIEAKMPKSIEDHVLKELRRYQSVSSASPESGMIRGYLDTMIDIPWYKETTDELDINKAKEKLDESHFGLEKIKDRILEYLSVKLYTDKNPQTIICFAGPPGVGKTTLAQSIAKALGRKFVKQSLGGLKDEAEIRGHRRTYIGALPGRIINGMREAQVVNPVFLLDEIDKIGSDYKGDPSASLLEVLDPQQNKNFADHYVEDQYDLSKVMFICTANYVENIPAPLYDRMEVIELSSYTEIEKFHICKTHVIRRELEKNGLEASKFEMTDDAIMNIIKYYTREAGVRSLERLVGSIVRKSIRKILAEKLDKVVVDKENVKEFLGKEKYSNNEAEKESLVGVVTGLAYTQFGGDTLQIECATYKGKGGMLLTGKLGDVMKESAQAAYSWVRSNADELGINQEDFEKLDIHIHVPEGAVPKDGPSAGVTMTTAIASAFSHRKVRCDLGMTGEVTLRGRVLPIGGLKEKSIAANRAGLKKILIPAENVKDLDEIPEEVKKNLEIVPVSDVREVLKQALL